MSTLLKDRLSFADNSTDNIKMPNIQSKGLWARTEVMGSYDDIERDGNGIARFVKKIPTGISKLGETLFRTEVAEPMWTKSNMVPIGGCQFAMELLYGVKNNEFTIPTLYSESGGLIGLPDSYAPVTAYDTPEGQKTIVYDNGNFIQLFGIGITGTAENDITVHSVDYRETGIDNSRTTTDGMVLTGTMIPFRYTSAVLKETDAKRYFGKKVNHDTGEVAYYLKRFESDPIIRHIWKTGEDVENETPVDFASMWTNSVGTNVIESFTECTLRISKHDVKEWFASIGQEDRARINTIALFTGQYVKNSDGSIGDYRDVRMFSKLNIPVEHLSMTKDLNLIYRVYTA